MTRYATFTGTSSTATSTNIATGTALKTILQLVATTTDRLVPIEWGISFDGTTASNTPVEVRLQRQTTAGSGGSAGVVLKLEGSNSPAASATVQVGPAGTWTTEPTASDILAVYRVPPTSGLVIQYPLGREPIMEVSTRLAIVTTSAQTVNATAYMMWDE